MDGPAFGPISKKQRLTFAGESPAAHEMMDTPAALLTWQSPERRFLFICDSKSLVDTICGHASLERDDDLPILERITRTLGRIFEMGWRPPEDFGDPVVWMPRSNNRVADGLACPAQAFTLSVMSFRTPCEVPVKSRAAAGQDSKWFKVVKHGND